MKSNIWFKCPQCGEQTCYKYLLEKSRWYFTCLNCELDAPLRLINNYIKVENKPNH